MNIKTMKKEAARLQGIIFLAGLLDRPFPQHKITYSGKTKRLLNVADNDDILADAVREMVRVYIDLLTKRLQETLKTGIWPDTVWEVCKIDRPAIKKLTQKLEDSTVSGLGKIYLSADLVRCDGFELSFKDSKKPLKTAEQGVYAMGWQFDRAHKDAWNVVMVPAIREWLEKNDVQL